MTTSSSDCSICCEKFTDIKRSPVECPKCSFKACKACVEKNTLNQMQLDGVKCMMPNCDNHWTRGFLSKHMTNVFMHKKFRDRRKQLLYEHEMSRMPDTMLAVENHKKIVNAQQQNKEIRIKRRELKEQINKLNTLLYKNEREINIRRRSIPDKQKRAFIHKCPSNNCKGYLSSAWKCEVCSTYTCSKCYEIKGQERDAFHECKPENIEAVKFIKKDTRPCPSCGSHIHKVSGCDQMWCTQCHNAFSWKTGRRINGTLHNPHFYEWQRQNNNGVIPRAPGDVRCGGLPYWYTFRNKIAFLEFPATILRQQGYPQRIAAGTTSEPARTVKKADGTTVGISWFTEISKVHRGINHFQRVVLHPLQVYVDEAREQQNQQMRINYILNVLNDETFKKKLIIQDTKNAKRRDILDIYILFNTVLTERMIDLFNDPSLEKAKQSRDECKRVLEYCRHELKKISVTYNQSVGQIMSNFYTKNIKYTKADLLPSQPGPQTPPTPPSSTTTT